jgi:hypothetical protein
MAVGGPYFSDLLLLVIYVSGLRFSPNMDQQERKVRTERYMLIVLSLIADELSKPSSLCTARELMAAAAIADRQRRCSAWLERGVPTVTRRRHGCSQEW